MLDFDKDRVKQTVVAMAAAILFSAASMSIAVAPAIGTPNTVQAVVPTSPAGA